MDEIHLIRHFVLTKAPPSDVSQRVRRSLMLFGGRHCRRRRVIRPCRHIRVSCDRAGTSFAASFCSIFDTIVCNAA